MDGGVANEGMNGSVVENGSRNWRKTKISPVYPRRVLSQI